MANKNPPRRAGAPRPQHRPSKFTEQQLAKALRLGHGCNTQACRVLQQAHGFTIDRSTMGRLVASSPRLQSVKAQAEEQMLDFAEAQLRRLIEEGNVPSILFFLRWKGAKRGYVDSFRHRGDPAAPIIVAAAFDFTGMSAEELRWLRATLAAARARALAPAVDESDD